MADMAENERRVLGDVLTNGKVTHRLVMEPIKTEPCPGCGKQLEIGTKHCPGCGMNMTAAKYL